MAMAAGGRHTVLLSKREAADRLRVSIRTLDRLIAQGDILAARIGKLRLMIPEDRIESYIRERLMEGVG